MEWEVVLATFVSPIIAVAITLWHQGRDRTYQRRLTVFTTMMRMRRHPLSTDYVGALNLVPIEFHSKGIVISKYKELMSIYADPSWISGGQAIERLVNSADTKAAELLSSMATVLKVKIDSIDILQGGYSPKGWSDEEALQQNVKYSLNEILSGQKPLQIQITGGNDSIHKISKIESKPTDWFEVLSAASAVEARRSK
jgi:hypothetical protein